MKKSCGQTWRIAGRVALLSLAIDLAHPLRTFAQDSPSSTVTSSPSTSNSNPPSNANRPPVLQSASASAPTEPAPTTATTSSQAGLKPLTAEMFQGGGRVDFDGSYATGMTWDSSGNKRYLQRRGGRMLSIDPLSDANLPAYDDAEFTRALQATGDFDEKEAAAAARNPAQWSADRQAALITQKDQIYIYSFADHQARRITPKPPAPKKKSPPKAGEKPAAAPPPIERQELTMGPRGGKLAFVRNADLYSLDARTGKERRLTTDGSKTLLNGVLDWVYQEELYGRGHFRSFWWSPDETRLAFLQLDESPVPVYTVSDASPHYPKLEPTNYPKAGDPNPHVRLGVVGVDGGKVLWADLQAYEGQEILIVRVSWGPDGRVYFQLQNRAQTWLDLLAADPKTGRVARIIHESSPAWVDPETQIDPVWQPDGTFLWLSTRDGFRHIYHYAADGRLVARVTSGSWDVREIIGADAAHKLVFFVGTRDSTVENHAYRVHTDTHAIERLTEPGFNHAVNFDPTLTYFFDTYSNLTTPTRVALRFADGALARMISENPVQALAEYAWSRPELVQFAARDGKVLNAMIIKPLNFDPTKKYPVWSQVYGGPAAPLVHNSWQGRRLMSQQPFVQEGYIYWICDTRLATCDGFVSAWQSYRRLGQVELEDLEDGTKWLIEHAAADPRRIGITGFSYGGYMTGYSMTHSQAFSVGICGAPVTDWHNYDSIYTERYMGLPADNAAGYDGSSIVKAAGHLFGDMLLVHGLIDDNVHFQNSIQFILELERNRKLFDLMVYPLDRHGIGHGGAHFRDLQMDYIKHRL